MSTDLLREAENERQRLRLALLPFVESLALPGPPFGRFKFHRAQEQLWLFYASQQMLSLAVRHGVWEQLDEKRKQEWLELLLSAQDPETGLFRCPVAAEQPIPYYRAITLKLASRLSSIDVAPRHPLPRAEVVCPSLAELPDALAALPWGSRSYSSGSQVGHWTTTRLQELKDRGQPLQSDPYVTCAVRFLESHQEADTGFWSRGSSLEDGMNGLLKTLSVYQLLERPLPGPERILDSLLQIQTDDGHFGDSCSPWNAMELFTFLARQTDHRRADVRRAALRLVPALANRRQPDGYYSATEAGCLTVHADVRLCSSPHPIGDIQGSSQTLSILEMIADLCDLNP